MHMRHPIAATLLVALGALTQAPAARADVRVGIRIAPPPPPAHVIVESGPRVGYVWAPGYWRWNGRRHVWVEGHYVRARRGYVWVADAWDHRGDRWYYQRGHWVRSR